MIPSIIQTDVHATMAIYGSNAVVSVAFSNFDPYDKRFRGLSLMTFDRIARTFSSYPSSVESYADKTNNMFTMHKRSYKDKDKWTSEEKVYQYEMRNYGANLRIENITEYFPTGKESLESDEWPNRSEKVQTTISVGNTNIILTKTTTDEEVYYRGKIVLKNKDLENFSKFLGRFLKVVQDTELIYEYNDFISIHSWFIKSIIMPSDTIEDFEREIHNNKIISSANITSLPRNEISEEENNESVLRNNEIYTVTVTPKGMRIFMVFGPNGIWFIRPSYKYNRVTTGSGYHYGTIMDGILVPKEFRKSTENIWYIITDCLLYKNNISVQTRPHSVRMKIANTVKDGIGNNKVFSIWTKTYKQFKTPEEFFRIVPETIDEMAVLRYDSYGLSFYPEYAKYNSKRNLVIEWNKDGENAMELMLAFADSDPGNQDKKRLMLLTNDGRPFMGTVSNPFDPETMIDMNLLTNSKSGNIVRLSWNNNHRKLVPSNFNNNALYPDPPEVALAVWRYFSDPISEETLRGKSLYLSRKYFSWVREKLYKNCKENSNIIDIGSKCGGDVKFWRKFSKIVAVEPDGNFVEAISQKAGENQLQGDMRIIVTAENDSATITSGVLEFMGQADAIFIMKGTPETRDIYDHGIIQIVQENLSIGGFIFFFSLDPVAVREFFQPTFGGPSLKEYTFLGNNRFTYDNGKLFNRFGEEIFMFDADMLIRNFNDENDETYLRMVFQRSADEEPFMSFEESQYTRLFSYGKIVRNRTKQESEKEVTEDIENDDKKLIRELATERESSIVKSVNPRTLPKSILPQIQFRVKKQQGSYPMPRTTWEEGRPTYEDDEEAIKLAIKASLEDVQNAKSQGTSVPKSSRKSESPPTRGISPKIGTPSPGSSGCSGDLTDLTPEEWAKIKEHELKAREEESARASLSSGRKTVRSVRQQNQAKLEELVEEYNSYEDVLPYVLKGKSRRVPEDGLLPPHMHELYSPGDENNCLFFSALTPVSEEFRNITQKPGNHKEYTREKIYEFKEWIRNSFRQPYKRDPSKTVFQKFIGDLGWEGLFVQGTENSYAEEGITKTMYGNGLKGDEFFNFLSYVLGVNILFVRFTPKNAYKHDFVDQGYKRTIIISVAKNHFQPVAQLVSTTGESAHFKYDFSRDDLKAFIEYAGKFDDSKYSARKNELEVEIASLYEKLGK